ncbi:MAG: hypothetical protein JW731_02710 [Bacteroidales bacterium]|nr:hypothetical protein [Bacteroidales bacterium]
MIRITVILLIPIIFFSSCSRSQDRKGYRLVGGPCEGCEAVFEYGNAKLSAVDTLPDFHDEGEKIKITGTVYQWDGTTPAKDVILYVYHTNQQGIYTTKGNETGWGKRNGYIRGWMKTGRDGKYSFYTLKPAAYPDRSEPAHIHITILEPDGKYYWLGSYHFMGDSLLTEEEINPPTPRGGSSGLVELETMEGILFGERDFILGKNIAGYN